MRVRISLVVALIALSVVLGLTPSSQAARQAPAQAATKQDGVTFTGWWNDAYDGQGPVDAMTALAGSSPPAASCQARVGSR